MYTERTLLMELTSAQMTAAVESNLGIPVGQETNHSRSVTGEPYVVLSSGGEWAEGGQCPAWHPTKDHALKAYLDAVETYLNPGRHFVDPKSNGVLYWRTVPELAERSFLEHEGGGHWREVTLYSIYSRLLISNKRVLEAA